jgi:hypothetical protein
MANANRPATKWVWLDTPTGRVSIPMYDCGCKFCQGKDCSGCPYCLDRILEWDYPGMNDFFPRNRDRANVTRGAETDPSTQGAG